MACKTWGGKQVTNLDLIVWILVGPLSQDVPVEGFWVAGVSPNVLDGFVADVHVTFRDRLHIVGGNSRS